MRAALRRRHVDRHRESRRRVPVVGLDAAPEVRTRAGDEPDRRAEQAEVRGGDPSAAEDPPRHTEAAAALGGKRATVMSRVFRPREALLASLDGTIVPTVHWDSAGCVPRAPWSLARVHSGGRVQARASTSDAPGPGRSD